MFNYRELITCQLISVDGDIQDNQLMEHMEHHTDLVAPPLSPTEPSVTFTIMDHSVHPALFPDQPVHLLSPKETEVPIQDMAMVASQHTLDTVLHTLQDHIQSVFLTLLELRDLFLCL